MTIRQHYRCVGIGIGPANLSLASLLYGKPEVSTLFLERSPRFEWHDGQLFPDATLQVSMLKDLVSLSDPTNPFSFLSYLCAQGRMYHFINAQFESVPRREFRNYLEWASSRNPNLVFGEEVEHVDFDGTDFVVATSTRVVTAENVVVGVGQRPWVPLIAADVLGADQFHVNDFSSLGREVADKRVCVVGGGQSGAEAFLDLISHSATERPRSVTWISRRSNFYPIDDSPFTNDFYMPGFSDHFYGLPVDERHAFNEQNVLTSDGISESTLREIYQRIYVRRFVDKTDEMIALYPGRSVVGLARSAAGGWTLSLVGGRGRAPRVPGEGPVEQVDADVVVWATGFRVASRAFLDPIADRLDREGDELRVDEDFAVRWDGPPGRNLFVQNQVRGQRGLADPNLSLLAWRSQRIADRITGTPAADGQQPGFVGWKIARPAGTVPLAADAVLAADVLAAAALSDATLPDGALSDGVLSGEGLGDEGLGDGRVASGLLTAGQILTVADSEAGR